MKKIVMAIGAVFCCGLINAQTPPPEELEKKENPATNTTPEVIEDVKENSEIKRDVINKQNEDLEVQPRKDQIRTRKHIKNTPDPSIVNDTVRAIKRKEKEQ